MTTAYKRFAALRPADTSEAELYEVPASTEVIGTLSICNQDNSARTYDVAFTDVDGAATGEDWLASAKSIAANETHQITGIAMPAASTIRVKASVADKISFIFYGMEIT